MRLIDADALKARVAEETKIVEGFGVEMAVLAQTIRDCIYEELENSPTIGGWISVEDRLPDRQTPVIVYVPPYSDDNEKYIGHVGMAYYTYSARGGYWAGTDGNVYGAIGIIHEPTHWMPMPEPPKEVEV